MPTTGEVAARRHTTLSHKLLQPMGVGNYTRFRVAAADCKTAADAEACMFAADARSAVMNAKIFTETVVSMHTL